jgi:ABC-type branched-subunit amino acid transport system substrate-binding protein
MKLAAHVRLVTNDPGTNYDFTQLDEAIKAILAGQKIRFNGATGPINFGENGRISAASYDVWQHMADGSAKVVKTIKFAP